MSAEWLERMNQAADEVRKWRADLDEANAEHLEKESELSKEHYKKEDELLAESLDNRVKLWEEYQEDIANINEDLAEDIAGYQLDAQRETVDLDREYQLSQQDANRKYHEQEIKAERDYQERMKRLRDEFLFDLEDALRERDALQVLRLIRRYKLDVEQEKKAGEEAAKERKDNYQQELEDLKRKHEEQERQNRIDLQRQIDDANTAAEQKRIDAKENWDKAVIEEAAALAKRKEEEDANYADRQVALEKDLKDSTDKINKALGDWAAEHNVSMATIKAIIMGYMGKDGILPAIYNEYIAVVDAAADKYSDDMAQMQASLDAYVADVQKQAEVLKSLGAPMTPSPTWGVPQGQSMPDPSKFHAKGGSFIATKPTMAVFGEAGAEMATFTPLGKGGKGKSGRGTLEVSLAPGLIGQIVDNTLGEVAVVMRKR
jgi:hypothetical protein